MMTSLMSIFDPSMSLGPSLGWVTLPVVVISTMSTFWLSPPSLFFTIKGLTSLLLELFKTNKIVFFMLFAFILEMSMAGLLPMVFSPTSHLSLNLSIALSLWLGMMMWYLKSNLSKFLSHLTPVGSPLGLAPMLVVIELVSNLIRPLTLSLRLMANVMAGHMILTLISKGVFSLSTVFSLPLFIILMGFLLFELGVALIQSYVFSNLMFLYWEESDDSSH